MDIILGNGRTHTVEHIRVGDVGSLAAWIAAEESIDGAQFTFKQDGHVLTPDTDTSLLDADAVIELVEHVDDEAVTVESLIGPELADVDDELVGTDLED